MGTPVKRIEKEFLFKALYNEKFPLVCHRNKIDYTLFLAQPVAERMIFRFDKPILNLKLRSKLQLMFSYHGQTINFAVEVDNLKDNLIICQVPDTLYKNLARASLRVTAPSDFRVVFTFKGEQYDMPFPMVNNYEEDYFSEILKGKSAAQILSTIDPMVEKLKQYANGYKMVSFKDYMPKLMEELILCETCKALFLPSTLGEFIKVDPYNKKRIITEEIFKRYMESTGVRTFETAASDFMKELYSKDIFSAAWVPILFQNYIVGYIHIWSNKRANPPLNLDILDIMYELTKILCYSLEANGHFVKTKVPNTPFEGKMIDISLSGLFFSYPSSSFSMILQTTSELKATIITPIRNIEILVRITRRQRDGETNFFGCKFLDLTPEDASFLSEALYGKDEDDDAIIFSGQV